ncbi:hypothetical protein PG995_003300 [Apiospora arundinis]
MPYNTSSRSSSGSEIFRSGQSKRGFLSKCGRSRGRSPPCKKLRTGRTSPKLLNHNIKNQRY